MRIGHGYDAHRLAFNRQLKLGGILIDYKQGLAAHSDGDVVIHALCDALLGAAGLSDIGQQFPDNDIQFKNIDSRFLLRQVLDLLHQKNLAIEYADLTIIAEAPRMAPHIQSMRECLASDLQLNSNRLNIKATTTEGMGFVGRQEGIACHAVVLLQEND